MKKSLYLVLTVVLVLLMHIPVSAEESDNGTASAEEVCVRYITDSGEQNVIYKVGDTVLPPSAEERSGYIFVGWRTETGGIYSFTEPITEDITLTASYTLIPAVAIVKDVSFVYDGESRSLALDGLYHALEDDGGYYTFEWYRSGVLISSSETVSIKSVGDSGSYSCKVTFHYGGESVKTSFDNIKVKIDKCGLSAPYIAPSIYTGALCVPDIIVSDLYTYDHIYPISAGKYEMVFTLSDYANYRWEGLDSESCTVVFEVLRAPNKFKGNIDVFDVYIGAEQKFSAESTFGEVRFLYSKSSNGSFTEVMPQSAGNYFAKAIVDGTDNYYGLESNAIPFTVLATVGSTDTDDGTGIQPLLLVLLLIFILAVAALGLLLIKLTRAAKGRRVYSAVSNVASHNSSDTVTDDEECEAEFSIQLGEIGRDTPISDIMGVDARKADTLISDSLARSLIRRDNAAVVTRGNGRACVSIDTLNNNFLGGDRVDINALKEKGLVPESCAYLEIKGEGFINRPLTVYANEFSLRAVKMLALCGGEAIKVITFRQKDNKKY